jgi:hypothetical protein
VPDSGLDPLQERVLRTLASAVPGWVLTGGGALVGFHLKHRQTRDLDLFWRGRSSLEDLPHIVREALRREGLAVESLQTAPSFHRFRVTDETKTCIVDLVADSTPAVEPPSPTPFGETCISVDTRHEILVSKLCALLGRCELRDLQDVKALVDSGADLDRALADAPIKDGGFSRLTLAWVLRDISVKVLAAAAGWEPKEIEALRRFQEWLIEHLTSTARPSED